MNLFNEPDEPKPTKQKQGGHAAKPGTGPEGESCKTCQHLYRHKVSKVYHKCMLMRQYWTGGFGTDVRCKDPACKWWEPKEPPK